MNQIAFVIITAIVVSIDSFVAGLSMGVLGKKSYPLCVALVTLLLSIATMLLGKNLNETIANVKYIGCATLFIIGLVNILRKDDNDSGRAQVLLVSTAVALDGAVASFSLAAMGITSILMPIIIALAHLFASSLGLFVCAVYKPKNTYVNLVSGSLLVILSIVKVFT